MKHEKNNNRKQQDLSRRQIRRIYKKRKKLIVSMLLLMILSLGMRNLLKEVNESSEENLGEVKIVQQDNQELVLTKIGVNYLEDTKQTILNLYIQNNGEKIEDKEVSISLLDEKSQTLDELTFKIQSLDYNDQTKINMVIDKDLRNLFEVKMSE